MPLSRLAADVFGVVTICLVSLLVLFGLLCVIYSVYFRSWIRTQSFQRLSYFNGPWVIRITLVLISIWWGLWEIVRLTLLRDRKRALLSLSLTCQKNLCKFYIISNLGFAEPCMVLTVTLLLCGSLQRRELGSRKWNVQTAGYILLFCLPVFIAQLVLVLIGPKFNLREHYISISSVTETYNSSALCTYPLLGTIILGLFTFLLVGYFSCVGMRMLSLVINKGLRRRIYVIVFSVVCFLPLRVLFLGFSVLSRPGDLAFEALVFLAFLVMLSCELVGICLLVYCPIIDSLAVGRTRYLETREGGPLDDNDGFSLINNPILLSEYASTEGFVFSFSSQPASPLILGRPMIPLREVSGY